MDQRRRSPAEQDGLGGVVSILNGAAVILGECWNFRRLLITGGDVLDFAVSCYRLDVSACGAAEVDRPDGFLKHSKNHPRDDCEKNKDHAATAF
jgi:hypothetical protein